MGSEGAMNCAPTSCTKVVDRDDTYGPVCLSSDENKVHLRAYTSLQDKNGDFASRSLLVLCVGWKH